MQVAGPQSSNRLLPQPEDSGWLREQQDYLAFGSDKNRAIVIGWVICVLGIVAAAKKLGVALADVDFGEQQRSVDFALFFTSQSPKNIDILARGVQFGEPLRRGPSIRLLDGHIHPDSRAVLEIELLAESTGSGIRCRWHSYRQPDLGTIQTL